MTGRVRGMSRREHTFVYGSMHMLWRVYTVRFGWLAKVASLSYRRIMVP